MAECPICGRELKNQHGVKIHSATVHGVSLGGKTVECTTCGTEIERQPYELEEYDHHFCSDDCEVAWRRERYSGETNPNWAGRVTLTCEQCGDDFEVLPSRADTARFCSYDCVGDYRSDNWSGANAPSWEGGAVTLTCEQCGEKYEVPPAREAESRYCSYECLGEAHTEHRSGSDNPSWSGGMETLECEQCGKEYEVTPAKADDSRFCSAECLGEAHTEHRSGSDNPMWRGGYEPYYGPNWRVQRRRRLIHDQARCQDCGLTEPESLDQYGSSLEIHHETAFQKFVTDAGADYEEANRLSNLVTLCKSCHASREH